MRSHHSAYLYSTGKTISVFLIVIGLILGLLGMQSLPARADDLLMPQSPQNELEVPPSLFGVDMYQIDDYFGVTEMAAAGAYWVRPKGVFWSEVQPVEGQPPDWNALAGLDVELQNAAEKGMQVILPVSSTPQWALKPGVLHSCGPIAEEYLDDFGEFLFALVNRYKDQVKYWEIWNEPDIDPDLLLDIESRYGCWGDEDDEFYGGGYYAQMLEVVFTRIKEADPLAQVLVGGLLLDCDPVNVCPQERSAKFLQGILNNGGGAFFDGISYHAYDYYLGTAGQYFNDKWNSSWDTTGPVGGVKASYLKSVLYDAGIPEKYLFNTEASVVCDEDCGEVFETTKAYYLAQSFGNAFESGLQGNLWFSSRQTWRSTDLLTGSDPQYPAYYAYQFAQSMLSQADYVGIVKQFAGVTGYEFRLNDCPTPGETCRLWQIWSLDGSDHLIELPDYPYAVYDVDGDALGATLQQTITLEPVYVQLPVEFKVRLPAVPQDYSALQNGDFESGLDSSGGPAGWLAYSGGQEGLSFELVSSNPTEPELDTDIPSGNYSMLLGNTGYPCSSTGVPLGFAAVEQAFTVPNVPDGTPLHLDFNYVIYTQDGSSSIAYDRFEVYLDDGTGPVLAFADGRAESDVSCSFWYRLPATGWQQAGIDLIQPVDFRGKTVTISFQNWNRYDHYYNTFTYLDDVKLVVGQ